ncbi:hypothetical protein OEZ85_011785 [Tetradesmus obliquus]|uniref:Fucosyltransferase n=1 Tax=Tetradesmus obliquus TaxID=3088 RepID=A0ABY8TW52_TETOB|nr:hypothetical protein OEZ85_011785 [Tetradesmus obliquus]
MLVAYNGTFFGQQWPTHALQCAVPCIMTSDTAKYDQRADVLVYHAPELDWDSFWAAPKPQHQLWALHSMERACLNNMDAGGLNTAAPTELMARYKFYLVFENVFGDPDWVSSTFFRALDAGAVPVVLGAPNVLKFAPGQRSIIRACDFDSAQDLADYLLYLDSNDTAYREYLSWKEAGPSAAFSSLMRTADLSPWCEVCIAAAQRNPRAFDAATQQTLLSHQQTKRAFDQLNARLDQEASIACRGKTAWWEVQPAEGDAALWARDEAVGAPARRMTS